MIVGAGQPGFIEPGSPEWAGIITPSKVPAILGLSRYESPFRLWHRMQGIVPPADPSDAFDIGHDMEAYAAARWLRRNPGWHLSAGEVQFHPSANHFPFPAVGTIDRRASRGAWRRIVEVKIARDLSDMELFGDDLTGDCPDDYAAQVTAQRMFVAATQPRGMAWQRMSHVFVIGPYFNERCYEIEYDLDVAAWIIESCAAFWESLQSAIPPDLDDSVATYACLKQLHPDIDDVAVDINPGLAIDYLVAVADEKRFKAAAQGAKNRMAAAMRSARYAKVGKVTVADRRNNGKGGVSLYAGRNASPDDIRLEGTSE